MKLFVRSALLAGIAVLAVAGTALAGNLRNKVMTVNLPGGLVARVEYHGDVAPKVIAEAARPELAAAWPHSTWAPFTMLDPISVDIDRQFDAMIRQARMLDALPVDNRVLVNWASAQALPAGAARYSYVATSSGKGLCTRSVEITSEGPNRTPRVTSSTSGNCIAGSTPAVKPAAPAHTT